MTDYKVVRFTRAEVASIANLPAAEIFPAFRRTAEARGLLYGGYVHRHRQAPCPSEFRTWWERDAFCLQNFEREGIGRA